MNASTNAINWFEIPSRDLPRAKQFYEEVFDISMHAIEMDGSEMAVFPSEPGSGKVSGSLIQGADSVPSNEGTTVYMNANPDLSIPLRKVEAAGGTVVLPKTSIGDDGFIAMIIDLDGNKVGFHSNS